MHFLAEFASSWDKYDLLWLAAVVVTYLATKKLAAAGNGELRDFLHENGVKLLVLGVVVMLVVFAHHSAEHNEELKFADWCMAKAGEALACFFGLIQGAKLINGNGSSSPSTTNSQPKTEITNIGKI